MHLYNIDKFKKYKIICLKKQKSPKLEKKSILNNKLQPKCKLHDTTFLE